MANRSEGWTLGNLNRTQAAIYSLFCFVKIFHFYALYLRSTYLPTYLIYLRSIYLPIYLIYLRSILDLSIHLPNLSQIYLLWVCYRAYQYCKEKTAIGKIDNRVDPEYRPVIVVNDQYESSPYRFYAENPNAKISTPFVQREHENDNH